MVLYSQWFLIVTHNLSVSLHIIYFCMSKIFRLGSLSFCLKYIHSLEFSRDLLVIN